MTTSSFPVGAGAGRLTYARSRLYLGITGVGFAVLGATALLSLNVPRQLLPVSLDASVTRSMVALGVVCAVTILAFLPLDLIGGTRLVRRKPLAQRWLGRWLRGVTVQWVVWMTTALALMLMARAAGTMATVVVFVLGQFVLAALRWPMARVIAPMPIHPTPPSIVRAAQRAGLDPATVTVVDVSDEGFVGGWSGIAPGTLVVPRAWATLPEAALAAQLARRRVVAERGAHRRGVLGAIAWNTTGYALVLWLSGATPATAAGVWTIAAGMTLWAFVGVLLLPTPSRAAVFTADADAAQSIGAADVRASIQLLDKWQDDEPTRPVGVERIFHPVPSLANRMDRIDARTKQGTAALPAHHLARHALWLGWGALTPISRAVHCNAGRTELWAMLPGD
jgi:hypothetical protein